MSDSGLDQLVMTILRPIRGCATDSQYSDVFDRTVAALNATRREAQAAAFERACRVICPRCSLPERYTPAERVGNGKRWFHRAINTSFEDGIASQCDAWTIRNAAALEAATTKTT